jgi:hypothetical protein
MQARRATPVSAIPLEVPPNSGFRNKTLLCNGIRAATGTLTLRKNSMIVGTVVSNHLLSDAQREIVETCTFFLVHDDKIDVGVSKAFCDYFRCYRGLSDFEDSWSKMDKDAKNFKDVAKFNPVEIREKLFTHGAKFQAYLNAHFGIEKADCLLKGLARVYDSWYEKAQQKHPVLEKHGYLDVCRMIDGKWLYVDNAGEVHIPFQLPAAFALTGWTFKRTKEAFKIADQFGGEISIECKVYEHARIFMSACSDILGPEDQACFNEMYVKVKDTNKIQELRDTHNYRLPLGRVVDAVHKVLKSEVNELQVKRYLEPAIPTETAPYFDNLIDAENLEGSGIAQGLTYCHIYPHDDHWFSEPFNHKWRATAPPSTVTNSERKLRLLSERYGLICSFPEKLRDWPLVHQNDYVWLAPVKDAVSRISDHFGSLIDQPRAIPLGEIECDLKDDQLDAMTAVRQYRVVTMSGGGGTGKTKTSIDITRMAFANSMAVLVVTPSNKAADLSRSVFAAANIPVKKMECGGPCTMHYAMHSLKYANFENKSSLLVILDEASMADLYAFGCLVDTVTKLGPTVSWLLVGDSAQLPSVGPGRVFDELRHLAPKQCITLKKVYRNGGQLLQSTTRLRQAIVDKIDRHLKARTPSKNAITVSRTVFNVDTSLEQNLTFTNVKRQFERINNTWTAFAHARSDRIVNFYQRNEAKGLQRKDLIVLVPTNKEGSFYNTECQTKLNGGSADVVKNSRGKLCLNDRVICTTNQKIKVNGDDWHRVYSEIKRFQHMRPDSAVAAIDNINRLNESMRVELRLALTLMLERGEELSEDLFRVVFKMAARKVSSIPVVCKGAIGTIVRSATYSELRAKEVSEVIGDMDAILPTTRGAVVCMDTGSKFWFDLDRLKNTFVLGYCITVHKAQGSEWKKVFYCPTAKIMLRWRLIYTAITRGKESVEVDCEKDWLISQANWQSDVTDVRKLEITAAVQSVIARSESPDASNAKAADDVMPRRCSSKGSAAVVRKVARAEEPAPKRKRVSRDRKDITSLFT